MMASDELAPKRLLLIGDIRKGRPPETGEQVKNQLLSSFLQARHSLQSIDTAHWKQRPWVIFQLLAAVLLGRHDTIILSASSGSVHTLLRALGFFPGAKAKTLYLVVGGYLPTGIREGRFQAGTYAGLKGIVVQGEGLRQQLAALGIKSPIVVMPNSKPIQGVYGDRSRYDAPSTRFLFLSRIAEPKGTQTIFEALGHPMLREKAGSFSVDFYGRVEAGYQETFFSELQQHASCRYQGYLDVTQDPEAAYRTFSAYHAMLFPTHWKGEGFPGVVIDAYVSGLPVIASDWNMNREVVTDGVTGRIIPAKDPAALALAMSSVIDDRTSWASMSLACHASALAYDAPVVLDRHLSPLL